MPTPKKIRIMFKRCIPLVLLAVTLVPACTPARQPEEETLYVSILPLRGLLREIVGPDMPIEVLVPVGASPETFEPTPRQLNGVSRARALFDIGLLDFETTLLPKIARPEQLVTLSTGIDLIAGCCSHAHGSETAGHPHPHGIDPHIWTSPRALLRMAENAYEALHRLYPDSTAYTDNYGRLRERLQRLDTQTDSLLRAGGARLIVIYHPALTYYARDYGLQQVAIEEEGKEPSARHLAQLIREAREQGVRRIFYQSQFPASTVEIIAKDLGAEAVRLDPLCEDAIGNIEEITRLIVQP